MLSNNTIQNNHSRSNCFPNLTSTNPFVVRPKTLAEAGLTPDFVANLLCKHLYAGGVQDLCQLIQNIALVGNILEPVLDQLRCQSQIEILSANESSQGVRYTLTDQGQIKALNALEKDGYSGPAPIPLDQYTKLVKQQSVENRKVTKQEMLSAFADTTIHGNILDQLGPALHSGRAMIIYGLPGTGKTFICKRLSRLLGDPVHIPYALLVGDTVIQYYDPVIHIPEYSESPELANTQVTQGHDARYVYCKRPVAISGGELTLEMLEMEYDSVTRQTQAPVQLKVNNGIYIIDDLGRQRVPTGDLFNRWIVPLEERIDYLTTHTGKRFPIPFDLILIFSTNLHPNDLADDAFLRRLGYKINFQPLNRDEYRGIWVQECNKQSMQCDSKILDLLFEIYQNENRPLLPCHPRDLISLVNNHCCYNELPAVMSSDQLHAAWNNYFINQNDGG